MFGEDRFGLVEPLGHSDVLGALAGEEEDDPFCRRCGGIGDAGYGFADEYAVVVGRAQRRCRFFTVADDGGHRDVVLAPPGQRVGHIGEVWAVRPLQHLGQGGPRLRKRRSGLRRQQQHLGAGRLVVRRHRRCLLEHDVRVGAADAERTHSGAQHPIPFPGAVLVLHDEWALLEPQFRVRAGVVQRRGDRPVFQAQNRLDETRDPGGNFQVADVRLDRTQHARTRTGGLRCLESRSESLDFDGVTERGAGAVALDVAHRRRVDARHRVSFRDDIGLGGGVGCRITHFRRSVIVDRRSADDGVNAIPGVDGGLQWLEDHHRDAAAEDRSIRSHVERSAVAHGRHHRSGRGEVTDVVGDAQRGSAGQCDVTLAGQQAQAGQVNRDQRRRARGLDGNAGATQVERVRDPRCQEVLVVLQEQAELIEVEPFRQNRVRVPVREQIV